MIHRLFTVASALSLLCVAAQIDFARSQAHQADPASPPVKKEPEQKPEREPTPLQRAIYTRNPRLVAREIMAGGDVNADHGRPLIDALSLDEPEIAMLLIRAGADVNAHDADGSTPMYFAAGGPDKRMLPVVRELFAQGALVNSRNIGGATPLHAASGAGITPTTEIMRFLLDHGADVAAVDDFGNTPLHWVCIWEPSDALDVAK
ncbi:MAG TPA: ankyrin repeat domain-containing protein [Tepidisphaeraceae bacterium]|jgi:ankyrin repeat protein